MTPSKLLLGLICVGLMGSAPVMGQFGADGGRHPCQAKLLASVKSFAPGEPFLIGVEFRLDPHWHVYWQSPRDGGVRPELTWKLPKGFSIGPIRWPTPERYVLPGDVVSYGYADVVLLHAVVTPPKSWQGKADIGLDVTWQVCDEICLVGEAKLSLALPSKSTAMPSPDAKSFSHWQSLCPPDEAPRQHFRIDRRWQPDPIPEGKSWVQSGTWIIRCLAKSADTPYRNRSLKHVLPYDLDAGGISEPECRVLKTGAGLLGFEARFEIDGLSAKFSAESLGALVIYEAAGKDDVNRKSAPLAFPIRGGSCRSSDGAAHVEGQKVEKSP